MLWGVSMALSAANNYSQTDLAALRIDSFRVYMASIGDAVAVFGRPLYTDTKTTPVGVPNYYPYPGYWPGAWYGPWGAGPWGPGPYYSGSYTTTITYSYSGMTMYFEQYSSSGGISLGEVVITSSDYTVFTSQGQIKVGDSAEKLGKMFPESYAMAEARFSRRSLIKARSLSIEVRAQLDRQRASVYFSVNPSGEIGSIKIDL